NFERDKGYAWVYIADEFYIAGGYELPPAEHYGEFPQIENGIGLSRLFIDDAIASITELKAAPAVGTIAVVTGSLFSTTMRKLADDIKDNYGIKINVIEVENNFFGGRVNVTGLLTGSDVVGSMGRWLTRNEKPSRLLVPDVMLNGDGLMLDGHSPDTVAELLGIHIDVVRSSGTGFIEGILL
ncbi:MAG TPA: DUF512 domain-containing protein, partial [Anaerolineae bacterium]|nr:DUF512 domain-containing protein [Anaerolineae bacterium]